MNPPIEAVYRIHCTPKEVEKLARDIVLEQTVEVPESLIQGRDFERDVVGEIRSIRPSDEKAQVFDVAIDYPEALASGQISQLLNLVYGNISMKRQIRLTDLTLPPSLLARFPGPNLGTNGIRKILGIHGRPLLSTALKPRGAPDKELAKAAHEFALGGGDLVKDDHNLVEADWDSFRRRVDACQTAVEEANRQTGRRCLYFPNLAGRFEELEPKLQYLISNGVRGVLLAPMLLGLDWTRHLAEHYPIALMAHPTFTGAYFHDPTHGMPPRLLLGKLFRLIGCDISVFPNTGGRFTFSQEDCRGLRDALTAEWDSMRPAFPCPAGGMRYDTLPAMGKEFGEEAVLLIGGALLSHSTSLQESTRLFLDRICDQFPEQQTTPQTRSTSACEVPNRSACEIPTGSPAASLLERIPFHVDHQAAYTWHGRESTEYKKAEGELPFQGVRRVELVGKHGEKTAFDLRYFELAPGGFTSLEKHQHTHVVIGARGQGVLLSGQNRIPLNPFDIGYVPPLQVHQLRNESDTPFGFFCIVDHNRDRPQSP